MLKKNFNVAEIQKMYVNKYKKMLRGFCLMKEQVWKANGEDCDISPLKPSKALIASDDKMQKTNVDNILPGKSYPFKNRV